METFHPRYAASRDLFERAARVIPGGIYGHTSPAALLPGASPYYATSASGCRYCDVDGNEYIDFMCGYGPIVLGHAHPEVEEAADRQRRDGDCFNHPTARMVELAERLNEMIDFADWSVFGKNGSDMTTWAIRLAREHTSAKKILHVRGAYHGIDAWCSPSHGGLIEEDRQHIHTFPWNDLEAAEHLFSLHTGLIAAVVITPYHHPVYADSEMPAHGFLPGLEQLCRRHGALLILDDIRAGFRLHAGGSHRRFGFEPDISCFCKALGNGHALSAAVGKNFLRPAAGRVFLTGSYWNGAVAHAASLKTLEIIERDHVPAQLEARGKQLREGLENIGQRHGASIRITGPAAAPFMRFAEERNFRCLQRFCALCLEEGVFFHPHHNWFLSAAHTQADIEEALTAADRALQRLAGENGLPGKA